MTAKLLRKHESGSGGGIGSEGERSLVEQVKETMHQRKRNHRSRELVGRSAAPFGQPLQSSGWDRFGSF